MEPCFMVVEQFNIMIVLTPSLQHCHSLPSGVTEECRQVIILSGDLAHGRGTSENQGLYHTQVS